MSDDGRYVLLNIREGCDPVNRLYYCDLEKIDHRITGEDKKYHCISLIVYKLSIENALLCCLYL